MVIIGSIDTIGIFIAIIFEGTYTVPKIKMEG
jgi:hypothetical protein